MHHIFIDFEMCMVPKKAAPEQHMHFEIIQFGAVKLDDNLSFIDEFTRFVKPQYGELTPEMTRLTGITPAMLANQGGFIKVFTEFVRWIGDEDYLIYSWSGNDLLQLKNETRIKKFPMKDLQILEKWVDFQRIFTRAARLPNAPSLGHALELMQIEFVGSKHFADADAYNTARLFRFCTRLKDFGVNDDPALNGVFSSKGELRSIAEEEKHTDIAEETEAKEESCGLISDSLSADKLKAMLGF